MKRMLCAFFLIVAFAVSVLFFSHTPVTLANIGDSFLTLAVRYVSNREEVCRKATEEEKSKMLPHMRREEICERERKESQIKLWVDGKEILSQEVKPLGLRSDGLSVLLHTFPMSAGKHLIQVSLGEEKGEDLKEVSKFSEEINFEKNRRYLVEYQKDLGFKLFD